MSCAQNINSEIPLPMWRMCCPTVLPFTSDVTLKLLSQWPPLKSSFPSWDTTNSWAETSTPGENGPAMNLWVLREREENFIVSYRLGLHYAYKCAMNHTNKIRFTTTNMTLDKLTSNWRLWGLWWRWNSWKWFCRKAANHAFPSDNSGLVWPCNQKHI